MLSVSSVLEFVMVGFGVVLVLRFFFLLGFDRVSLVYLLLHLQHLLLLRQPLFELGGLMS